MTGTATWCVRTNAHARRGSYVRLCGPATRRPSPGGRADLGNGLLIHFTQVRILPGAPCGKVETSETDVSRHRRPRRPSRGWVGRPCWNCPGRLGGHDNRYRWPHMGRGDQDATAKAGRAAKDTLKPWRDRRRPPPRGDDAPAWADLRPAGGPALPPPARRPARRGRRRRVRGPDRGLDDPAHARVDRAPGRADGLLGAADAARTPCAAASATWSCCAMRPMRPSPRGSARARTSRT